jgi:site-specific DNA recombinase
MKYKTLERGAVKMKAAIYTRVSTNDQVIRGESLDMQKDRLIAYVKSQGWELYKTYEDGGYSGKDTNRPAFQELMSDAGMELFNVLVVYKIDRLSRSILDFHKTMEFLNKHGISFVSITQQFDTTTSMGRLMLAILVDFANFEREIDVDRAFDAYINRLRSGISSGAIPYGYRRENKNVIIVKEEAEQVQRIFRMALQGLSMNQVARKTGFTKYHIRSILTNPFYCGYLTRRRDEKNRRLPESEWKWYEGKHEAVIPLETFQQVAAIRKKNSKIARSKYHSLFSHLIYCPYCKHNLTFHTKNKKSSTIFYYECDPVRLDGPSCGQYLREEGLEQRLYEKLDGLFVLKTSVKKEEQNLKKTVSEIDRKIKRLVKLAQDEDIALVEVEKQIGQLKERRAKILAQKITEVDYKEVAKKIKNLKEVYPYMSREEKSNLWRILIKRITAEKHRLVVEWRGSFKPSVIMRDRLPPPSGNRTAFNGDERKGSNSKEHKDREGCLTSSSQMWRRGEDSNLRGSSPAAFQVRCHRPLGHPSVGGYFSLVILSVPTYFCNTSGIKMEPSFC